MIGRELEAGAADWLEPDDRHRLGCLLRRRAVHRPM